MFNATKTDSNNSSQMLEFRPLVGIGRSGVDDRKILS